MVFNSYSPVSTIMNEKNGADFFIATFGLIVINFQNNEAVVILFPETPTFHYIPEDEADIGFIKFFKKDNDIFISQEQDMINKSFCLLDRSLFKSIDIKNKNIFKIRVKIKMMSHDLVLGSESEVKISYEKQLEKLSVSELESELENLQVFEDYEKMALVRDEIKKR